MVVLDTSTLLYLVKPSAKAPLDPKTGKPVERCKERVEFLLETLSASKVQVLLPTPILAEMLVGAQSSETKAEYLRILTGSAVFRLASFDTRAAVELSIILDGDLRQKKKLTANETWAKVRFDRQIVAISKIHGAAVIYTDDAGLAACAKANGIATIHIWQLDLRPVDPQQEFSFPEKDK